MAPLGASSFRRLARATAALGAKVAENCSALPQAWRLARADRALETAVAKGDEAGALVALADGADPLAPCAMPDFFWGDEREWRPLTPSGQPDPSVSLFVAFEIRNDLWKSEPERLRAQTALWSAAQASVLYEASAAALAWELMRASKTSWLIVARALNSGAPLGAPSPGALLDALTALGCANGRNAWLAPLEAGAASDMTLLRAILGSPATRALLLQAGEDAVFGLAARALIGFGPDATSLHPARGFADLLASSCLALGRIKQIVALASQAPSNALGGHPSARELMPICWALIERAELSALVAAAGATADAAKGADGALCAPIQALVAPLAAGAAPASRGGASGPAAARGGARRL